MELSTTPRFLLDTNIVIGLLKGDPAVSALISNINASLAEMAVGQITRMELLSFANLTESERSTILAACRTIAKSA
jgi:predicted nucleic acid-binding protein